MGQSEEHDMVLFETKRRCRHPDRRGWIDMAMPCGFDQWAEETTCPACGEYSIIIFTRARENAA